MSSLKNRKLRIAANEIRKGSGQGGIARALGGKLRPMSNYDKNLNPNILILSREILENLDGALLGKDIKKKAEKLFSMKGQVKSKLDGQGAPTLVNPFTANFNLYNEKKSDSDGTIGKGFQCGDFAPKISVDLETTRKGKKDSLPTITGVSTEGLKPENERLSVLTAQHFEFCPTNALTSEIEVFANAIPTHEMSRCVPFLDVTFFTSTPPTQDDKPLSLSLAKALVGDANIKNETGTQRLAQSYKGTDGTQFGMELFTLPQTVTPLNRKGRTVPLLDPFRPFMSITSFDVTVVPAAGLMEKKKAKLSITLHDRSRLHEIADFVRPQNYAGVELLIEYGWSHPDGNGRNSYGVFLNAMRKKEKFRLFNSSFSLQNNGEVSITLDLIALGVVHTENTSILNNSTMKPISVVVSQIREKVRDQLKKSAKGKLRKDIKPLIDLDEGLLSNATIYSKDATIFSTSVEKLKSVPGLSSGDAQTLVDDLKKLQETRNQFNSQKKILISGIKDILCNKTKDPFFPDKPEKFGKSAGNSASPREGGSDYITLGKLFSFFVGRPLAATNNFTEVQLFFYAFSTESGFTGEGVSNPLSTYTVDQFLIKKEDVMQVLDRLMQNLGTSEIPIETFMNYILKTFVMYPFSPLTKPDSVDDEVVQATLVKDGKRSALSSESPEELREKYKVATTGFRPPKVQIMFDSIPIDSSTTDSKSAANQATVLRVHIFDNHTGRQASIINGLKAGSNTLDLIKSANKTASGALRGGNESQTDPARAQNQFLEDLKKAGIEPKRIEGPDGVSFMIDVGFDKLKRIIKQGYPSLTYGSDGSVITSARFSSLQSSGYKNTMMKRAGRDAPRTAKGTQSNGLPLQIQPADASITMLGCPILRYAQHFFVDFGTGTSMDDLYFVKTINHKISPGTFTTSLTLANRDGDAAFQSMFNLLDKSVKMIEKSGAK